MLLQSMNSPSVLVNLQPQGVLGLLNYERVQQPRNDDTLVHARTLHEVEPCCVLMPRHLEPLCFALLAISTQHDC